MAGVNTRDLATLAVESLISLVVAIGRFPTVLPVYKVGLANGHLLGFVTPCLFKSH